MNTEKTSRRQFLKDSAALAGLAGGGASILGARTSPAETPTPTAPKKNGAFFGQRGPIIDFHHHYLTKTIWLKHGGKPGQEAVWWEKGIRKLDLRDLDYQIEKHIEMMDATGIDAAVLNAWDPSLEDAKVVNNDLAQLQKKYPKRLIGFAHSTPAGGKKSIQEVEHAVKDLGLQGVAMTGHPGDKPLDSKELFPFYEKVSQLDVPIFVHPSSIPPFEILRGDYELSPGIGRELDLALACCELIYGGVLEEFPNLKFIIAHLGGGIGAIKERLVLLTQKNVPGSKMKHEFDYYFSKLYFDTAGFVDGTNAIMASLYGMKASQIVFGTDFPHGAMATASRIAGYMEKIRALPIPKADIDAILEGNASRLFPGMANEFAETG